MLKNLWVITVEWSKIQLFICKYLDKFIWICVKETPIKIYIDSQTFAHLIYILPCGIISQVGLWKGFTS